MVFATDEQLARLGGKDTRDAAAREREDEQEALPADVEPMKPADVVKATRDEKTREVLAAANENWPSSSRPRPRRFSPSACRPRA